MSLKYRDNNGTETPVAGLNGTSGELVPSVSVIRSGIYTPSGPVQAQEDLSFSITFSEPMPDNDYQVIFGSSSNGSSSGTIQCAVRSRNTTGFTGVIRNVGTDTVSVASSTFTWFAFKLMTDTVHEADSAHIAQNTANFAPAFSEVTSYAVGDYCTYNNVLYRCTTAHTAGVWVAGHFTQVTVGGDLGAIVPSNASSSNKLVTKSDNGCFTFTIGANQTATITVGSAYVSLFASLQVQGAGARMLCLEYNNTTLYGKTIRSGNEYEAERGVSTFTFLNTLTFANSASKQMTITNNGSETETITIMGNVVNVAVA